MYQCPNCGRTYSEFQNVYYCGNCNYKLLKQENIKNINNPNLSKREYKIVGTVADPTKPQPKCPTCQSTDVEKISLTSKVVGGALFGLFSSNVRKTMHCKNCGYKWWLTDLQTQSDKNTV